MKVHIKYKKLSDSAYCEENKDLFLTPHPEANFLVEDILRGTPTCYLVSGYRGAGKSSFIKQIEETLSSKNTENKEIAFVHVNFSRYHTQTHLLRKLIRGLYLTITERQSFINLKESETANPKSKKIPLLIETLYEKTFYDSSDSFSKTNKQENQTSETFEITPIFWIIISAFFLLFFSSNWLFSLLPVSDTINLAPIIISIITLLGGIFKYKNTLTTSDSDQTDFNRKSMYDDEIADYHFFNILKLIKEEYKVVFVLDELDKVEEEDLEKLLKEMKPYLVCGEASFIAVAGQNLYYKYFSSRSEDDAVLNSIFSRFIHIPLKSRIELHKLFDGLVEKKETTTEDQEKALYHFKDQLVFEAKFVPRKFVALIRHFLKWDNTGAYLEIDDKYIKPNVYTKMLDVIYSIDDQILEPQEEDQALKDYYLMQLLISCHRIISSKDFALTFNDIITHGQIE